MTVEELPNVNGDLQFRLLNGGADIANTGFNKNPNGVFTYKRHQGEKWASSIGSGPSATGNTDIISMDFGNDSPHNNMPPYVTVYVFHRTV